MLVCYTSLYDDCGVAGPHRVGLFVPVPQSSSLTVSTRVHLSVPRQENRVILTQHHLYLVKSKVHINLNEYKSGQKSLQ